MAASSLILDTRRPNKHGEFPVKIRITHEKKNVAISTGISIPEEFWDGREVSKKHPQAKTYNNEIKNFSINVENIIRKLTNSGRVNVMTASDIKTYIEKQTQECFSENTFTEYYLKFMESREKSRTKEIYKSTLNRIEEFTGNKTLLFEDINVAWSKSFESFLKEYAPSVNARSIHLRNIRAVFNSAIEDDIVRLDLYPFRKFKIKREKTAKRSLTIEQLKTLFDCPCDPHEEQFKDVFKLIFYLIGINIVDLCHVREIRDGRIEYHRAKTNRLYSIKVEPEAMEIIEKYKGNNQLLNILDRYIDYKDYARRVNENLKLIGHTTLGKHGKKDRKPLFPSLTTYWARHTWATIAAILDIPKETIAAALGHGGNTVTDIYIDFDQKKIDKANRDVIDYVLNYKPEKSEE